MTKSMKNIDWIVSYDRWSSLYFLGMTAPVQHHINMKSSEDVHSQWTDFEMSSLSMWDMKEALWSNNFMILKILSF